LPTSRYRGYGGGRYGGGGGSSLSLSFPPFTPAVKWLIIINVSVFFLLLIGQQIAPLFTSVFGGIFSLWPKAVVSGYIWQLFTYCFLHFGLWEVVINMLMLWMFGAQLEMDWGRNQFLEFYFFCVVGAGMIATGLSFTGILGLSPNFPVSGSSAAVYGLLLAFGMLHGDSEIFMFPLPFMIKAKYMAGILVLIILAVSVKSAASFILLAGLLLAFLYIKFLPRKGLGFYVGERYFGFRNSYYRWKRRRAAKKFEVYMRKHDSTKFFDEYGNFRDPKELDKKDGEPRPPWVN